MASLAGREGAAPVVLSVALTTAERTVGAGLSGELERARDRAPRAAGPAAAAPRPTAVDVRATGAAGQSLGAFATDGLRIAVSGVSNDYVAKGLSGGTVVVRPPTTAASGPSSRRRRQRLPLRGDRRPPPPRRASRHALRRPQLGGERGGRGTGAHGCEYMTGGRRRRPRPTGRNFGAG